MRACWSRWLRHGSWIGSLGMGLGLASAQQGLRLNGPLARQVAGDVTEFALSPDSTRVVYRADQEEDEVFRLYSVPIDGGPAVALGTRPVAGGDVLDFEVSPDGKFVAYRADALVDGVVELFSTPIRGRLPSARLSGALVPGGGVQGFAFAEASRRVVYLADQEQDERFELFSVARGGGTPVRLNGPLVPGGDVTRFRVSPDGRHVVFAADASVDGVLELFQVGTAGGVPLRLGSLDPSAAFEITPDSQRVVFASTGVHSVSILGGAAAELWPVSAGFQVSPDSSRVLLQTLHDLFSVPVLGGAAQQLTDLGFARPAAVLISPDSRRVAFNLDAGDSTWQLHTVPLAGGPVATLDDGSLGFESAFRFTPDSRSLVYTLLLSSSTGSPLTYRIPSAGGAPEQLSELDLTGGAITPDSRTVLCGSELQHLYGVPLDGGEAVQLDGPSVEFGSVRNARLSPDGARVVFLSEQEDDHVFELFSVPTRGGSIVKLNAPLALGGIGGDVQGALFSPDGAWVVYRADQDTDQVVELYAAPVAGGDPVKLSGPMVRGGDVQPFGVQVSPDSRRVVYTADQEVAGTRELFSVPIAGGPAVKLDDVRGRVGVVLFAISPDSSRVVYENDPSEAGRPRVFSVPIDGGPSAAFTDPLGGIQFAPQISPDSTRVVFLANDLMGSGDRLVGAPIEGGAAVPLHAAPVPGGAVSSSFRILSDSSGVVFSGDIEHDNVFELFLAPLTGPASVRISGPLAVGGNVLQFAVSPDATRVVFVADVQVDSKNELYVVTLADLVRTRLNAPLPAQGDVSQFALSPDSTRVVYRADALVDESHELFSVAIEGGPVTHLNPTPVAGGDVVPGGFTISPDSSRVVYLADQQADEVFELFSVPIIGGTSLRLNDPLPTGGDVSSEFEGFRITADSSRVIFLAEQRADERMELFSVPVAGGVAPVRLNPPLVPDGDVGSVSSDFPTCRVAGDRVLYPADQDQDQVVELFLSAIPQARIGTAPRSTGIVSRR